MSGYGLTRGGGFGPYTVLDLHDLPEDGKGVELEDGWLVEVAAGSRHSWVARNLSRIVEAASVRAGAAVTVCDGGEWEVSTPAGVRKPDVFVIPREAARAAIIHESPKLIPGREVLLAAEVVSPGSSSERNDRVRKVGEYATVGIPQYWIVDHHPDLRVQVLRLGQHGYVSEPARGCRDRTGGRDRDGSVVRGVLRSGRAPGVLRVRGPSLWRRAATTRRPDDHEAGGQMTTKHLAR